MEDKKTGTVVFFDAKKGWGFIRPDGEESDTFCHYSDIACEGFKTLQQGQRVEFSFGEHPKKPKAVNIKVLDN